MGRMGVEDAAAFPAGRLGLLLEEDPGEAEDENDDDQDEEDLHPHRESDEPARFACALAAVLAVGGTLDLGGLTAVAIGLLYGGFHAPEYGQQRLALLFRTWLRRRPCAATTCSRSWAPSRSG